MSKKINILLTIPLWLSSEGFTEQEKTIRISLEEELKKHPDLKRL